MVLFVIEFSFVENQVCEVFNGILVYVFMRVFMLFFGIFSLDSWSMECSWIAPLTPAVMVIRGLIFQPLFLYGVDNRVVVGVFVCAGLLWESVVAVCEFDKLDCVFGRG